MHPPGRIQSSVINCLVQINKERMEFIFFYKTWKDVEDFETSKAFVLVQILHLYKEDFHSERSKGRSNGIVTATLF